MRQLIERRIYIEYTYLCETHTSYRKYHIESSQHSKSFIHRPFDEKYRVNEGLKISSVMGGGYYLFIKTHVVYRSLLFFATTPLVKLAKIQAR